MELKNILLIIYFLFKVTLAVETSSKPSNCNDALRKRFEDWKIKFNIKYATEEEEEERREVFCANSKKVQNHNRNGTTSYSRAENSHSDKTTEERNENMLGAKKKTADKVEKGKVGNGKPSRTKRTRTTRSRRTKTTKTVKNQMTTTKRPVWTTTPKVEPTVTTRTVQSTTIRNNAVSTKKTTFPWTTKSKPTLRPTSSRIMTTERRTTTTTTMPTTTRGVSLPEQIEYPMNEGPIPDFVNYTSDCTPAKDQYGCGACWAFAAVAVTEYWRNKAMKHSNLSEQHILDCNNFDDTCDGGWPTNAFTYMMNPGNSDGAVYQYKQKREECMEKKFPPIVTIPKVCEIELRGNETLLKQLVHERGPISVVIYVLGVMYSYSSGIFYETNCPNSVYNHAVTVVGFGSLDDGSDPKDYWIIKNSWGTSWGNNGYGLMARNKNNHCAIATYAMFPC